MIVITLTPSTLTPQGWTKITASALGLNSTARNPILDLCRQLVAAGHNPAEPAQVYRGQTLALHIRSIGEATGLTVKEDPRTRFAPYVPFPSDRVDRTGENSDQGWVGSL